MPKPTDSKVPRQYLKEIVDAPWQDAPEAEALALTKNANPFAWAEALAAEIGRKPAPPGWMTAVELGKAWSLASGEVSAAVAKLKRDGKLKEAKFVGRDSSGKERQIMHYYPTNA